MDENRESFQQTPPYQENPIPMENPAQFVPNPSLQCPYCGAGIRQGQRFCVCCGKAMNHIEVPAAQMQRIPTENTVPYETPAPAENAVVYEAPASAENAASYETPAPSGSFASYDAPAPVGNYVPFERMAPVDYAPTGTVAPATPKKKKVWLFVLIGVSALLLGFIIGFLVSGAINSRDAAAEVAIVEEEKNIFGTWELTEANDPDTGDPLDVELEGRMVLNSNLSGKMTINGKSFTFTWVFAYIDNDGDYYYSIRDDGSGADMYYIEEYNELWVYTDSYWMIFTPSK